jgi:hypothetical protein
MALPSCLDVFHAHALTHSSLNVAAHGSKPVRNFLSSLPLQFRTLSKRRMHLLFDIPDLVNN